MPLDGWVPNWVDSNDNVCVRAQLCSTLCDPVDRSLPGSCLEFSRQEYWSRLPFPTPGDLPDPRIESASLVPPVLAGGFFYHCATWEASDDNRQHLQVHFFILMTAQLRYVRNPRMVA